MKFIKQLPPKRKFLLLRSSSHAGLPLEALALVDLLVLTGARRFTGSATSPFTWAVRVRCAAVYQESSRSAWQPAAT